MVEHDIVDVEVGVQFPPRDRQIFINSSMAYSNKVVDRFEDVLKNPKSHGVGRFDPNDPNVATGLVGAPACGDVMKLDLKLEGDVIAEVKFKT